ncbi:hypothetical protein BGZ81_008084 [Podila clonocystis]|nr:hypothetical protein BGZ81_008084 [Podila clonocystis]
MKDDKNTNKAPSVPNSTSQPPPTADTTMDLAKRDSLPAYTSGLVSSTKEASPELTDKEQPSPPTPQCSGGSFGLGDGSFGWGNKNPTTPSVGHSFAEKSPTTTTSEPPPAVGDPSDQRSSTAEEAILPIIPCEDNAGTPPPSRRESNESKENRVQTLPNPTTGPSPPQSLSTGETTPGALSLTLTPPETAEPTFAPSAPIYGAPPTAPPRKYICGEFRNNLGAFPEDLHSLPIADWCTPDSEFESHRDLSYAEAHAHNLSMDEQRMRTHWHPKRYLRSQTEDYEDVEIPIRNTTARLVNMIPCKEYEDMALFVPAPRDKYWPCEERNWASRFGSASGAGMGGGWGSNTPAKSSSTLPPVIEDLGQNPGQEMANTKVKKGSSSEDDKEVIIISNEEVEEATKVSVKVEKRKPTSTSTKAINGTPTSIVRDGKDRAREPSSSSKGEILGVKSYQEVTSKPMSHKEQRKMEHAVKRALEKPKSKRSLSAEREQKYEKNEQGYLDPEEHVTKEEEQKTEEEVPSSIPTAVYEQGPEDLEGERGASGAASRQERRGPQDKAVGACLRNGRDDHTNATRSASRSSKPLDSSSTKPDPAPSEPLALPEVASAALVSLVDRSHHPLEDWWAMAMAQMDKFNAYFSLPIFGARAAAPSQEAEEEEGEHEEERESLSQDPRANENNDEDEEEMIGTAPRTDRAETPSMAARISQAVQAKSFFGRALAPRMMAPRLRDINHAATTIETTMRTTPLETAPVEENEASSPPLGWATAISVANNAATMRSTIEPVLREAVTDPVREEEALVLNLDCLNLMSEPSLETEENGQIMEGTVEEYSCQQGTSSSDKGEGEEEDKEAPLSPVDLILPSPRTDSKRKEYINLNSRKNKRIRACKTDKRRQR